MGFTPATRGHRFGPTKRQPKNQKRKPRISQNPPTLSTGILDGIFTLRSELKMRKTPHSGHSQTPQINANPGIGFSASRTTARGCE